MLLSPQYWKEFMQLSITLAIRKTQWIWLRRCPFCFIFWN